jgi:hypothetical protein
MSYLLKGEKYSVRTYVSQFSSNYPQLCLPRCVFNFRLANDRVAVIERLIPCLTDATSKVVRKQELLNGISIATKTYIKRFAYTSAPL